MRVMQVLCGLVAAGGIGGLLFYQSLNAAEQDEMDQLVGKLAWDLFEKSVSQLNFLEARTVHNLARAHFG